MKYTTKENIYDQVGDMRLIRKAENLLMNKPSISESDWQDDWQGKNITIRFKFQDDRNEINAHLYYFSDRSFRNMFCSCSGFTRSFEKPCVHKVAALLALTERDIPKIRDILTDKLIETMEDTFIKNSINENVQDVNLKADWRYEYTDNGIHNLYLSIGNSRIYVVKDIGEFIEAMNSNKPLTLGKNFTAIPKLNSFDEQSKKIVEYFANTYFDKTSYNHRNNIYRKGNTKALELTDHQFDGFFEMFLDTNINATIVKEPINKFTNGNPQIKFKLWKDSDDILFSTEYNNAIITTSRHTYIPHNGTLYRTDKEFGELTGKILPVVLRSKNKTIIIDESQSAKFNSFIVNPLSELGLIIIDSSLAESYKLIPLEAKVYMDYADGFISARIEYWYNNVHYDIINSQNNPSRDIKKEIAVENVFSSNNFVLNQSTYFLEDINDNIYDFVGGALKNLNNHAEIYLTEAFKKIKIKNPQTLSAGVRLSGNLLEVDFNFDEYTAKELIGMLGTNKASSNLLPPLIIH